MLSAYRVLDLSDERGMLCGQILADLGADVIQVEPQEGSPVRALPPFYKDDVHPEKSLVWWALARGKRGIRLDLESHEGRDRLKLLAAGADVLIESAPPGSMAALGLGPDDLRPINPTLVYVSISAFGQRGPKSDYADTDLVVMAASGALYLTGDEDRAPLRASVPQAFAHASTDAACAALIALAERRRSGLGQSVDVSAQQSATVATMFGVLDVPYGAKPRGRAGTGRRVGDRVIRTHYRARDGWVVIVPGFARPVAHFTRRLFAWAAEEGLCDESVPERDWSEYGVALVSGALSQDEHRLQTESVIKRLLASKTRAEILKQAVARKLLLAPILSIGETMESEQFVGRGYPTELSHPALGCSTRYPGPFAKFSRTPLSYRRCAPTLGEHEEELLAERPRKPTIPTAAEVDRAFECDPALPLAGVKVLDLFWVLAGPGSTRVLADYGATVVHAESMLRRDTLRAVGPHLGGRSGPERSGPFHTTNAGKLGITLDLSRPEGRDIVRDLVRWADVVTESFSPGVMQAWGLDYASLREIRPDLIMISSCLMGQTGPMRSFAGFGALAASVTGLQNLAGWPDRAPTGPYGAYTDFIAVRYNALAILAALEHRARTGEGQYIDMAQAEAGLHFVVPAVLDYTANGRSPEPRANWDPVLAPHGVYPTVGTDRWAAIAVRDERDWRELCAVIGRQDLAHDPELATAAGRRSHSGALDAAISEWTREREPEAVESALQARGVPAHAVHDMETLYRDRQLAAREHFIEVEHPEHGMLVIEGSRSRLSRTPARAPKRALTYGCDNRSVLEELLGYSPERIAGLAERRILL